VLKGFAYLKKLNLTYNNLETIPQLPRTIETLILTNNSIATITNNILMLNKLAMLDLSNNSIEDISSLTQLKHLKHLFLKNNKVKFVRKV
jgi:Leucine Rich Repeat.